MFALFVAFLSPLFAAAENVIDSHVANKIFQRLHTIVFYYSITNILVIPILFFFGKPQPLNHDELFLIIFAGMLDLTYQFPYYAAMRRVDTSVTSALLSLGELSIPVLAFFIVGEKLLFWQYVGFGIIIVANILLSLKSSGTFRINKGFWLMLLAANLLSLESVMFKKIMLTVDWVSTMFYYALFTSLLSCFFLVSNTCRHDIISHFHVFKKRWKIFVMNEVFSQAAALTALYAISLLPVAVFVAIDNTEPIFTLLYGVILIYIFKRHPKEKVDPSTITSKLFFYICIIIGVVLVARN